ncbi:MAG: class I SAM-dependent methyltransferase [Paludibacteraceae bacterium]|nr:class I SAM-dependent methyltransferase [Paludibacteraceae bacterium]
MIKDQQIEDYILSHIEKEPKYLTHLTRLTHLHTLKPRMLSGHLEGRMLKMFVGMVNAKRVLEIGTFTGYSALCMAEALPEDGEVHTCEIFDELEPFLEEVFAGAGEWGGKVHLHIGDAADIIPTLDGVFDVAYLDGNKRRYVEDLEIVYPKMRKGGLIIADNTLWDGHVVEPSSIELYEKVKTGQAPNFNAASKEAQTVGIMAFNDFVANDPRFETVLIPVRDGMTLLRVL